MKPTVTILAITCLFSFSTTFTGKPAHTNQFDNPLPDLSLPKAKFKPKINGSEPYTPTKSQWLTLWSNANSQLHYTELGFAMGFATDSEDRIDILVVHDDVARKSDIDQFVKQALKRMHSYASHLGWEAWIKTNVYYNQKLQPMELFE